MKTARWGRTFAACLAVAATSTGAWGASPSDLLPAEGRLAFEVGTENFRWQEFDDSGLRLLTEQGPRLLLHAAVDNRYRSKPGVLYSAQIGGFGGDVDYDGQDSNGVFVGTRTGYRGWNAELTGGYRSLPRDGDYGVDLIGSVGVDFWEREIEGNINANGQPVSGFIEEYTVGYGRVGVGLARWHTGGMSYLQLGFKRPFSIDEDVEINNQDVTLAPGEEWSGFVSYRISFDDARGGGSNYVTFYYDTYRLGKSPVKSAGAGTVWQPKSDLDRFGVKVGYAY